MSDSDKSDVAKREEEVLKFWKENQVFEKTLAKEAPRGEFVFYDGPPFATGTPHSGSLLSSVSKDVIPRYKTMRGYRVRRRWGWDTHGLPIESLVEKKLGLKNKKEILALGIEKFNETARGMVLEYVSEWKRYVERVGRWVDFDNSYKTMDNTFIESVWWALKEIHKKGNLYEGKKVLMYCTHDETVLAKAEIAMDETYKDIREEAATVKFRVKNPSAHGLPENTFILAWTTTPWTLPGNAALAVGSDISYIRVVRNGEHLIVAEELAAKIFPDFTQEELSSWANIFQKDLIGIEYEPLFAVPKIKAAQGKTHTVLAADFVTTTEGAGIVHIAPMYGEDDFALGKAEGLPMVQLLNGNGTYNDDAPEFLRGKYIKKAEAEIKAELESRGLLFSKEPHTHRYPHCYRCGTPLIYNAVSSWFINIQAVKEKMLSENEKITWVPEHLKHGRFQKIVETAPDWTISRNRFWASPLPIWKDKEGNVTVIGSLEGLKARTKKSGNTYFTLRHGEADSNVERRISSSLDDPVHLTETGRAQIQKTAEELTGKNIDIIIASPFPRTKETAEIVSARLGISASDILWDSRLVEYHHGIFDKELLSKWHESFPDTPADNAARYTKGPDGGESLDDLRQRVGSFLYELEGKYSGKNILIISHGEPLWVLQGLAQGLEPDAAVRLPYPVRAKLQELPFVPLPHNKDFELDYHLPYIDRVELVDEQGEKLTRIPEVVDCWVESGAMPFAADADQRGLDADGRKQHPVPAVGDFVSEYIGQTRAWFYYMHAMSVQLFGRQSFRNVITTGNINAGDGQKLSKSKKNYTDPYVIFDKFGADAFRYYLMSSVVMQAEDLQFKDDDVKEAHSRIINILRNTHAFYSLYKDEAPGPSDASQNVLDRWIIERLKGLVAEVTEAFDRYDTIRATRPVREFIDDFSTWYVRRSRDRVKGEDIEDKKRSLATLRYVLLTLSKIIAPVMPFVAEEVFQGVKEAGSSESVHLEAWPIKKAKPLFGFVPGFASKADTKLISDMAEVRRVVSLALEARSKADIKVRQPLQKLAVRSTQLAGKSEFLDLIRDEVNVKSVAIDGAAAEGVILDTEITKELKEEGMVRELSRFIQDLRKQGDFHPKDKGVIVAGDDATRIFLETHWGVIQRVANLERLESGSATGSISIEGVTFNLDVVHAQTIG